MFISCLCSFSSNIQNPPSWCQHHRAHHPLPSETPLTSCAWSNLVITPVYPPLSHGALCRRARTLTARIGQTSKTWWRSHVRERYSGGSSCWAWVPAPPLTAPTPTPIFACRWPERDAAKLASTSALPFYGGGTMTTAGAEWPTAPPTCWASVLYSQVTLCSLWDQADSQTWISATSNCT